MTEKTRRVEVVTNKTIRTYAFLHAAARESLWHAEHDEEGQFFDCLSCITFCALTLEAFFNHIGNQYVRHWSRIERKLNPSEKLDLLADELGISIKRDDVPFNDFKRLFWFRDFTAHGKTVTEQITETHKLMPGQMTPTGKTAWERECTLGNAKRHYESTRQMVEYLHQATDPAADDLPFAFPSSAEYHARPIVHESNANS